jgi:PrtD family type I secretion system ABC transporter
LRELISGFRRYFLCAGLFSLVINLLLLAPPLYLLQVFDRVLTSRREETLLVLTLATLIALGVMSLLDVVRTRLLVAAGAALERRVAPRLVGALLERAARLSPPEQLTGSRDAAALRAFVAGPGILALFDAPWLPLFILIIFLFHPWMGAVALAGALLMALLAVLNERATRNSLRQAQAESRRAARFVDASVRNAELVRALGMHPAIVQRWMQLNDKGLGAQLEAGAVGSAYTGLTRFMRQLIQTAMLALGAYLVLQEHLSAGMMMAATIILGRALAPVETLVAGWRSLVEAASAWRRLAELLDAEQPAVSSVQLPPPSGALSVERVLFAHRGAERPALRGVSFTLAPGEQLGIIGPSAAGKSTLAKLLVGIWRPQSGAVRLDGAEVATWPREQLGRHLAYLPQDVELFAGTIAQNIARLGEPDSAEVMRAAQRAQVHELIVRLPQGYDTEVGELGQVLSAGQRQRVGLARALYGAPRLAVLDEPNANLDAEGEEALLAALRRLKQDGVAAVIIVHRPSLLASADRVLVLREGAVEMLGPRDEVLARVMRPVRHAA